MPAVDASQWVDATIPNVPWSSGRVVNTGRRLDGDERLVFVSLDAYSLTVRICGSCQTENPENARFCLACGKPLTEAAPGPAEERRIVSVVFVDLVDFTSRSEKLDPEDVRAFQTPYFARVRAEVERYGGTVEKFIGDAVLGVFGAPTAYGDDAERCVRAALAIRDWAADEQLLVRIAVNTGEAIVTLSARVEQGESMVAGDVINTASRLQSAAPVGSVLVGSETYASTRNAIQYVPAEPVVAKGKALPIQAWIALDYVREDGERVLTRVPMVGRDREFGALVDAWDRVTETKRPQLVTVFGPAGIGKSRLTHEFAEHVGNAGGRVLRGRAIPYGASGPYSAFSQHVKQIASVYDSDELGDATSKLTSAVAAFVGDAEAEEHARHLAMLVGIGGNGDAPDRETLFFSARILVEALASREPTLLVFDDIHWADDSLLDLLESLAARVQDVPLLLLALARPELLGQRPAWGGGLPAYSALALERLTGDAAQELAHHLLAPLDLRLDPRSDGRRHRRGQPALHRGARGLDRGEAGAGNGGASDQHPRDHRRATRLAAAAGALGRVGRGRDREDLLARRPREHDGAGRPAVNPRLARAARLRSARTGLADPGRPAVHVQAHADPRRRVRDPAAGGTPRTAWSSCALPRGDDRCGRPVGRGDRHPLARERRERAGSAVAARSGGTGRPRLGEGARDRALPRGARAAAGGRRRAAARDQEARGNRDDLALARDRRPPDPAGAPTTERLGGHEMWARVSTYQFPVAEVEQLIERFNAGADRIAAQPGLKRVEVLVSRKSGAGMTITVWESEDAMRASEDEADRLRQEIALEC